MVSVVVVVKPKTTKVVVKEVLVKATEVPTVVVCKGVV